MGKHKKAKKKKSKHSSSSNSESDEVDWAEPSQLSSIKQNDPQEDWLMGGESSNVNELFAAFTKDNVKKTADKKPPPEVEAGRHQLELNPYWKNGGLGLPPNEKCNVLSNDESRRSGTSQSFDKKVEPDTAWLRKSFFRAVDMAKEEGTPLEHYLAQRWDQITVQKMMNMFGDKSDRNKSLSRPSSAADRLDSHPRERPRFSRPDEEDDYSRRRNDRRRSRSREKDSSRLVQREKEVPRWKKKTSDDIQPSNSRPRWKKSRSRSRSKSPRRRKSKSRSPRRRKSRSRSPRKRRSRSSDSSGSRSSRASSDEKHRPTYSKSRTQGNTSRRRNSSSSNSPPRSRDKVCLSAPLGVPPVANDEADDSWEEVDEEKEVTQEEINKLAAQVMRTEIMGDKSKLGKMKANLNRMREAKERGLKIRVKTKRKKGGNDVVMITRTNKAGMEMPVMGSTSQDPPKRGATKVNTHDADGKRINYFHNEDKTSLRDLVQEERMSTSADFTRKFVSMAGKAGTNVEQGEYEDAFTKPKARIDKEDTKEKTYALVEYKKHSKSLDKCSVCIQKVPKHLIISTGKKCYLRLPDHVSLTPWHCLISPLHHVTCSTQLDEDVWEEMIAMKRQLVAMCSADDQDCLFVETAMRLAKFPHLVLHCIPLPRDCTDAAPVYFKKAIMEVGSEWAQNKKLVELKGGDIRRSIPKGFPYFSVEFGLDGGFAHVIENEQTFSPYFGQEIIGGMLDKGPEFWRHPGKENFQKQSKKVLHFQAAWKQYDKWTEDTDSD